MAKKGDPKIKEAYAYGRKAEQLAREYLLTRGYTVRDHNWSAAGIPEELDIIAEKEGEIVFCEVKARSNPEDDPMDAMTPKKIKHLVRAADVYLRNLPFDYEYRFDIALVKGPIDNCELEYIEDAFLPPFGK